MKSKEIKHTHFIVDNLFKIIRDKGITQETLSEYAGTAPSQMSKVFKGNVQLNFWQLSNIATCLKMREIDIITYPEIYELREDGGNPVHIMFDMVLTHKEFCEFGLKDKVRNKLSI